MKNYSIEGRETSQIWKSLKMYFLLNLLELVISVLVSVISNGILKQLFSKL